MFTALDYVLLFSLTWCWHNKTTTHPLWLWLKLLPVGAWSTGWQLWFVSENRLKVEIQTWNFHTKFTDSELEISVFLAFEQLIGRLSLSLSIVYSPWGKPWFRLLQEIYILTYVVTKNVFLSQPAGADCLLRQWWTQKQTTMDVEGKLG